MITAQEALELEKATAAKRQCEAQARIACAKARYPTFFRVLEAQIDEAACNGVRTTTLIADGFFGDEDCQTLIKVYSKYFKWLGFELQSSYSSKFGCSQLTFNW